MKTVIYRGPVHRLVVDGQTLERNGQPADISDEAHRRLMADPTVDLELARPARVSKRKEAQHG